MVTSLDFIQSILKFFVGTINSVLYIIVAFCVPWCSIRSLETVIHSIPHSHEMYVRTNERMLNQQSCTIVYVRTYIRIYGIHGMDEWVHLVHKQWYLRRNDRPNACTYNWKAKMLFDQAVKQCHQNTVQRKFPNIYIYILWKNGYPEVVWNSCIPEYMGRTQFG